MLIANNLNNMNLNLNLKEDYLAPEIEILDIRAEGVLCASTEILDEIEGEW